MRAPHRAATACVHEVSGSQRRRLKQRLAKSRRSTAGGYKGAIASDALSDCWGDVFSRGDLITVRQAVRGDWPIPEAKRLAIVQKVERTLTESDGWPRRCLSACRTIVAMDQANMRADHRLLNELLSLQGKEAT